MRWWIKYDKLSVNQRSVLSIIRNNLDSAFWIRGFAGTGKTLVLTHLMQQIANLAPNARLCYITYTKALVELLNSAPLEDKNKYDIKTLSSFVYEKNKYDYIFLDEIQDAKIDQLKKLKQYTKHLYVAGDFNQKIYDNKLTEDDVKELLKPEIIDLLEVFRLTYRSCQLALNILPEAKMVSGSSFMNSSDSTVNFVKSDKLDKEYIWIYNHAKDKTRPGDPCVILFPGHESVYEFSEIIALHLGLPLPPKFGYVYISGIKQRSYSKFNEFWESNNIPLMFLGNGNGSFVQSDTVPLIYLMTYHSVKGLDFKNVFMPNLHNGTTFMPQKRLREDPRADRRLLFVATTRSRENLYISYSKDQKHRYLSQLPPNVVNDIDINTIAKPENPYEDFF
ncbi:MAG: ATP-binding domain-containing protein [Deltaproteobacteria bacterium]|jgi:hypothetical protein|nr:ATP-binding domain-containing protein [Deltaproteobacteria bacterium]